MSGKLEINKVNRFDAGWDATTLYTGFRVRAMLTHTTCAITRINDIAQLERRLKREVGDEGTDWILLQNSSTGSGELYLLNAGKLIMWKLQDHEKFSSLFDRIEQHKDDLDEIREDNG